MSTNGWLGTTTDDGTPVVVPIDDLRPHEIASSWCWCRPFEDEGVIVHNSMDQRELFERGERKAS